jgi:hypothetical protein
MRRRAPSTKTTAARWIPAPTSSFNYPHDRVDAPGGHEHDGRDGGVGGYLPRGVYTLILGKEHPYSTDVRVPLYISGPGNSTAAHPTTHVGRRRHSRPLQLAPGVVDHHAGGEAHSQPQDTLPARREIRKHDGLVGEDSGGHADAGPCLSPHSEEGRSLPLGGREGVRFAGPARGPRPSPSAASARWRGAGRPPSLAHRCTPAWPL